jgi:hypothetical protein
MGVVHPFRGKHKLRSAGGSEVAGGGNPPYDGGMDARVAKLENDFAAIRVDLDAIKGNGAAKSDIVELRSAAKVDFSELRADMQKMNAEIKSWTLATMITIIGTMLAAIFGIATIFNNAAKTSAPAQPQQPPVVIYTQPLAAPAAVLPAPPAR